MIIPSTEATTLLLFVLSMLCWGSWANFFKLTGNWRFELFYFDFSLGVLLVALIAAFTFGSMGSELSFQDNLLIAGKTEMAQAAGAGIIFNLGNMLLVASLSLAGMSVSFPVAMGIAAICGLVWSAILHGQSGSQFPLLGSALVLVAVVLSAVAWERHWKSKHRKPVVTQVAAASGRSHASRPPLKKAATTGSAWPAWKGVLLAAIGGFFLGSYKPLVDLATFGDIGLGPYSLLVFFAIAIFLSALVFNLYFMNLPISGEPVGTSAYLSDSIKHHLSGFLAGILWCSGAAAKFVGNTAPRSAQPHATLVQAISYGSIPLAALWGVLLWHEFSGAKPNVRALVGGMFVLLIAGLLLLSFGAE